MSAPAETEPVSGAESALLAHERMLRGASDVAPEDRGTLRVADRVIEKIATHAATRVEHTAQLPRRFTERLPGRRTRTARAVATVSGRIVQLRIIIGVDYPVPIVEVTRTVRRDVQETVTRLCDVDVRDVDVVVARLSRALIRRRVL